MLKEILNFEFKFIMRYLRIFPTTASASDAKSPIKFTQILRICKKVEMIMQKLYILEIGYLWLWYIHIYTR